MQIIDKPLAQHQYHREAVKKDAIFIHHTAGSHQPEWTIHGWNTDALGRIGTAYVIGGLSTALPVDHEDNQFDGDIYRAFDERLWASHLGVRGYSPTLDKKSIGIELCNYGPLTKNGDRFFNYVNKSVPESMVTELAEPFRGYKFWHSYTPKQVESLRVLLLDLGSRFNITIKKKWTAGSFGYNTWALNGAAGLWTHANVRRDKFDCYPHPLLIQMLNSL